MPIEIKDFAALAALVLSLYNLWEARQTKHKNRRQTFEKLRQEVLFLREQRETVHQEVAYRLQNLLDVCESQQLKDENGKSHWIKSTISLELSKYRDHFGKATSIILETIPNERINDAHILDFEQKLGKAKRGLEDAKRNAAETARYEIRWERTIAEATRG